MQVLDSRPSWLALMLRVRGTVLTQIWPRMLVVGLVSVAVTLARHHEHLPERTITLQPFTLIGLALSIILGFRNTTCYQRFHEARMLWGRLVNRSRSFCRQAVTIIQPPAGADAAARAEVHALRRELVHRACAFVHGLRLQLRDQQARYPEVARLLPAGELEALRRAPNTANAMMHLMGERVTTAYQRGWIEPLHLPIIEASLTDFTDVQGGCERIKSTPIPFTYTLLIHRIAGFYCLALPLGIVDTVGAFTPLVALFVSYAFFGLDAIGDEIEDPFGMDTHDLPLEALSTMIEVNLRDRLGDADLPGLVRPVDGVLV